ncbi:hypothetical protein [Phascolarctobacterium succinatutens]|uniref:hypothetical protein n=1 Tax=Phascolarctobacterium succinatutens TaxID=626940 RepID=UPI00307D236F
MLKLSQKKRKALLALAVAAAVLGANNAFAASVHDKAITESNQYGSAVRTYWKEAGVYNAKTHTYTFNEDVTLKPNASDQDFNHWTPMFGGIYIAGNNPVTIDMQGHRLDLALNVDQPKGVDNVRAVSPNAIHVSSADLVINNVKGMELSAKGSFLSAGKLRGIYVAGTNQEGSYGDGKGLASLTINNADGWENAVKFHSSQPQIENAIEVWKNTGSADLKISGMVDLYVGNDSDVITVRGGNSNYNIDKAPTAYIGGGAIKAARGRAAVVSGGELSINSKLQDGAIVAAEGSRDVQVEGNILVKDQQKDQGILTLGMNTDKSYFKGTIFNDNGAGEAYMLLANGAQWTNERKGDYDYHNSSLNQLVGGEADAKAGNIFQKDSGSLTIDKYSGNTNIFYAHTGNGEAAENYAAGNTVIKGAAKGSVVSMVTDNTGVAMDNKDSVANVLNALAGKLTYSNYVNGENNLTGYVKIADGLTASSAALKSGDISFNKEDGKGSYSAQAPVVPEAKTEFTTTLTGDKATDTEYADANIIADDGTYKFAKDSTITTTDKHGADIKQAATINAEGKTLTFNTNVTGSSAVYALGASSADGVTVNADKLVINASSTSGRVEGINVGQGAQSKDNPMKLTINGDTEFNMKGIGYTLGLYANGNSEVTFNGNVTAMGNENSEWGLTSEEGAFGYYGCSLVYSGSNYSLQMGPKVTINGDVNAKIDGNCLFANGGHAKLTINGGGNIEINKDNEHNYYAMMAESGTTSMNVNLDENYDAVSARDNKLVLKGNVGASTGAINANEPELYTKVNLGLATADSVWTGVAHNGFKDEGNKAGDKTFYGAINVFLQNGATWNNEEWGETATPWGGTSFEGSHVAKFVGGVSDAKAGNIFQNDSNNLTIDNYSGNTNIFYAHTGNGEAAENYAAGDTVIRGAAEGSAVSLITDNTGVAMDNKDSVANVLNALAGKLTYSNYVNGENNLTGYVKIADGLTASSAALKSGDISFNKEDGKGSYVAKPEAPSVKEYKDTLTGFDLIDEAYADVIKDGVYKFAQDTKITNQYGMDIVENAQIDASGKTLTLVVDNPADTGAGIKINAGKSLGIKADTLKMELSGKELNTEGLKGINLIKLNTNLTVDGNLDITADGDCNTLGVYSQGNVVVNGDAKLNVEGHNGGTKYYGASGIYATSGMNNTKGGSVTVNGNVDFQGNANGLFANSGGAVVTVKGGSIVVDAEQEMDYAAIRAEDGTVNMNVVRNEAGKVTGADNNDVNIKGNVVLSTGAANASDIHGTESAINLGLTTAKSNLTGVVANYYGDGYTTGSLTFNGAANLWLQNGATWNNEEWGEPSDDFEGSRVANFVGGASEGTAGNIFQKDSNELTIDNYSGNTNIFYAHTGNGEAASNYAAGDTVIKHAEKDSVVSLITDNTGVAMDNKDSVANVLNALAGKLTYSNYVNGESNLTGYVKIADGLTASSAALKTGDITFSKEDGKGSYPTETPVVPPKTEFTTALTGDAATDTEYVGNIQDGKYVFGANTTINAAAKNAVEVKAPLTIDAGNNQLVLMAKQGDYISAVPLFKQAVEGTTSIKADKLVIKNCTNDFKERSGMEVTKGNVDINADVDMKLSAASNAYGIYVKANGSSVAIHGDLNLADSEQYDSINGLYVENAVDFGAKTSAITVDGKADINLRNGNAITAIRNGSTVSVGGGNIKIAKNNSKEFYALQSDGGVVNVNMNADKNAAGTATTVIEGNISAFGEKTKAASDMDVTNSIINIGLSDKDSSWTGTAFAKDLGTSGFPFKGIVNLYLANGATWNNEAWGKTNAAFDGSHVTKLAGGASEAAAGNIFQKDSNNLTIDNYSGSTNIFYAHTGNGENASNYAAGDTIIKSAAAGSAVSLITDSTGIAMENDASVANVLNALAGKLTYSNFVNGENNLNGSVKIADGLTSSSQTLKVDTIKFNKDTGKGYTKEETVNPGGGEKTTFTDAITGEKQGVYSAVQQEDLSYVFAEDASININQMTHKEKDPDWEGSFIISGAAVQNAAGVENLVINAADKTLKLNVALDSKTVPPDPNAGILNNRIPLRGIDNSIAGSTTTITAGTLDINIDNTYSRKTSSGNPLIGEGSAIGIYAKSAVEKAVVEVTGNTAIKAHGYNNVYGVNANGNAEIKLHGDLTMAKDGEDWALDNVIKGQNTTTLGESSWRNIAGINANGAGASVTVDGKTTIAAHGSGVVAADGATVNLGAADIEVKNNSDEAGYGFHALGAALGTVNVGGEGKTVTVKGNAGLFGKQGQKFASDSKESVINLKLTTEDSAWTGVAYKHFDAEKDAGLSGSMNLTLANGASWNNEKYGYVYGDSEWEKYKFTGSEIADFVGGASEAKAGNIFQKDANSLTIDNYSGNTNIFYAHTGNGEAAENYAAGDTVIKHAAEGSVVSMITDNTGVAMDNEYSVANVLNALAGKLTYSNFVNGEKNLTGYVKIADGLTASSKAMQTGNISFSSESGKGSLESGSMTPGITYPETQKPGSNKLNQGITGNAKDDYQLKMDGILKADGSYVFTQDPTVIEVKEGAAVNASASDIVIDTTKAKLELKGATGINAEGANVTVKGNTSISGATGINAANGNVTLNGSTVISGTDAAINAGADANVVVNGNNSALTVNGSINADGGNITVDSGKATGTIKGDINAANGGSVVINLTEKGSTLTGGYNVDGDSSIALGLANGATWKLTDGEEAAGMSLLRMAKGAADAGLTINGGKTEAEKGFLDMTKRTKTLDIAHYSGWETVIYDHDGKGDKVEDYKSGDTVIAKADKGSGVILSTDGSGITMTDKKAVEATLKALAQKVTYKDHAANGENLSGKVQIAEGLTSSSVSKNLGTIHWDENGKGQYDLDSVNWSQIIEGDYETFVMKGVRSAATTSLHTWRDNMQDTYTGADLADEDGMFAKALGGKTSSDVKGLKDSNTYYGVQVGYDKAAANGWHTGVAFDYRNGDSNYLLGGKGDNQMYSLGVYGVKNFENDAFFRVAAKVGRVQNEYDVYNEIRSLKLHGDYKANAYGLTMEYGKTFGTEESYFTPKAQLTWSQVGAKDYTAHTDKATMQINQDSYSSFVGRLGFEAGVKSEKGRVYAGLFAAHEFNGDISASYFANDGDRKHTCFDGEETWMEMKLGGTYDFSNNAHLYADIAKDFNGNFERKWKMNVGLRFEF